MEEVQPPLPKVNIILSKWIEYFLPYESILDTILQTRDTYLVAGDLTFSDKTTISIDNIKKWRR